MEMPEGWKTPVRMPTRVISLGELFDDKDLRTLNAFINKKDLKGMRAFLDSKQSSLLEKGVVPDYLYYYLQYAFRDKLKEVV